MSAVLWGSPATGAVRATATGNANPWTCAIAGARVSDYYRFGGTGLVSLRVERALRPWAVFHGGAGYLHFSGGDVPVRCVDFPGVACPSTEAEATFVPVSAGLTAFARDASQATPFVEVSPSLYLTRWSLEERGHTDRFGNVMAGFMTAAGMRLPINAKSRLELGLLYLWLGSGKIDSEPLREFTGEKGFRGPRGLAPFFRFLLTPPPS